jgi:4-hydroxyphenylpyruvate dioxygenase
MVVRNAGKRLDFLRNKFGFELAAVSGDGAKKVAASGDAVFVVSETDDVTKPESVTNAAFVCKNVESVVEKIARRPGNLILDEPRVQEDEHGSVVLARVKSVVGDVEHTLVDASNYRGPFLPNYSGESTLPRRNGFRIVNGIDHVTLVCEAGQGAHVARWYEENFGMQRLVSNRYFQRGGFV